MSQDNDIVTFLKEIDILKVIERIAIAWDQISSQTTRRSWRKLIPMEELNDERDQEDLPTNTDLANSFLSLGHEFKWMKYRNG